MNYDSKLAIKVLAKAGAHNCAHRTSFDLKILFTVKYDVI